MQAIDWLIQEPFMRQAFVTALAIATLCSFLSVFVVLKRLAFVSEGLSHAGFGAVGIAICLGITGVWRDSVILVFGLLMAVGIGLLSRKKRMESDTAVGILLAGSMALGVFMTDLHRQIQTQDWYVRLIGPPITPPSMENLLFGSLLMVDRSDMIASLVAAALLLAVGGLFFKELVFYCFDQQVSRVYGVPDRLIHYLLLFAVAITVMLGIRVCGFLLVTAMLIIPGATALLLSKRLSRVILISWLTGVIGVAGGLFLSLQLGNFSSGACIVLLLCLIFALALFYHRWSGSRQATGWDGG